MGMLANLTAKTPLSVHCVVPPTARDSVLTRVVSLKKTFAEASLKMKALSFAEACASAAL